MTKSRKEAAEFARTMFGKMFDQDQTAESQFTPVPEKRAWHWGRCEIKALVDFIYDGPPASRDEEIWHRYIKRNR